MICPKCGEDNADTFRFCGMCGTLLESWPPKRPEPGRESGPLAVAPRLGPGAVFPSPNPDFSVKATASEMRRPQVVENAVRPASRDVPPISGPSMLGLDQHVGSQASFGEAGPTMDSLREKSFSGLNSFLEPEQPKTGVSRIFLLVILLAALAGAGWWTYSNYLSVFERKPAVTTAQIGEPPTEKASSATQSVKTEAQPAPDTSSAKAALPQSQVSEEPSPRAPAATASKTDDGESKAAAEERAKALESVALGPAKPAPVHNSVSKQQARATPAKPSTPVASAGAATGDAAFRKGEAFLYGRGARENCDEAIKNLKAASAKSNAKARSAFGTMYATGHCVPRDLPTSYLWFALALRVDPNNQILEKDLSAVWNQMTPPERQMATRMKE